MAASAAVAGFGTALAWDVLGGSSYTTIAEIRSFAPVGGRAETIEVTHVASPDNSREYMKGLHDGDEVSVALNHIPGSAQKALADQLAVAPTMTAPSWQITWVNAKVITFKGHVTGFSVAMDAADALRATLTIKITGKVTWPS